ncbi:MAG: hypothetical protein ACK5XL_07995, partial [Cyclobacteriaceae bacterium]
MKRKMLSGKDVMKLGYPEGRAIGMAINTVHKYLRRSEKEEIYTMLRNVLADPRAYINDAIWSKVALELVPTEKKSLVHQLNTHRLEYRIYGAG